MEGMDHTARKNKACEGLDDFCKVEHFEQQATDKVVKVKKRCTHGSCSKLPSYDLADTTTLEYRAQHASGGVVKVYDKKCRTTGCSRIALFRVTGTKAAKDCAHHTLYGIVIVFGKKRRTEECGKQL